MVSTMSGSGVRSWSAILATKTESTHPRFSCCCFSFCYCNISFSLFLLCFSSRRTRLRPPPASDDSRCSSCAQRARCAATRLLASAMRVMYCGGGGGGGGAQRVVPCECGQTGTLRAYICRCFARSGARQANAPQSHHPYCPLQHHIPRNMLHTNPSSICCALQPSLKHHAKAVCSPLAAHAPTVSSTTTTVLTITTNATTTTTGTTTTTTTTTTTPVAPDAP